MSLETKAGLFGLAGIVFFLALIFQTKNWNTLDYNGYTVLAKIKNSQGLLKNADITLSGVKIGFIKSVSLEGAIPIIKLFIYNEFKIPQDSTVTIKQRSILGSRFVDIQYGNSKELLVAGDHLLESDEDLSLESTKLSFDRTLGDAGLLIRKFNILFDEDNLNRIDDTFKNLYNLSVLSSQKLPQVINKFEQLMNNFQQITRQNNHRINHIVTNIHKLSQDFLILSKQVKTDLPNTLSAVRGAGIQIQDMSSEFKDLTYNIKATVPKVQHSFKTMNEAIIEFKSLAKSLQAITPKLDQGFDKVNKTIPEFQKLAQQLQQSTPKLDQLIQNIDYAVSDFKNLLQSTNKTMPEFQKLANSANDSFPKLQESIDKFHQILPKFAKVADNSNNILEDNQANIKDLVQKSKNTVISIGKLLNKVDQSQLIVDMGSSYMIKDRYWQNYFSFNYISNDYRHYILGVNLANDYTKLDEDNLVKIPRKRDPSKALITAQIGQELGNFLVKIGIKKSQGGLGVEYRNQKIPIKIFADLYDFSAKKDFRRQGANLNLGLNYYIMPYFYLKAGMDSTLYQATRNNYLGLGLNFNDENLKYLFLSSGSSLSSLAK